MGGRPYRVLSLIDMAIDREGLARRLECTVGAAFVDKSPLLLVTIGPPNPPRGDQNMLSSSALVFVSFMYPSTVVIASAGETSASPLRS